MTITELKYLPNMIFRNKILQRRFTTGTNATDKDNLKSFDYGFSGGMGAKFGDV